MMHINRLLTVITVLLLSVPAALAQTSPWRLTEGQSIYPVVPHKGMHAHVQVYLPHAFEQRRWPVIVYLHGAGERGEPADEMRNTAIAKWLKNQPDFPFIVVSPQLVADAPQWDADAACPARRSLAEAAG